MSLVDDKGFLDELEFFSFNTISPSFPSHCPGGNQHGVFDLGLVQDEWKMYVKQPLDREKTDSYVINVTASDGLFVCETTVEVTVMDTNDNEPLFLQVRIELNESWNYQLLNVSHVFTEHKEIQKSE